MRTIGNILWVIFGGGIQALMWFLCGLLFCITIIGIPIGVACMRISSFVLWPFGRHIEYSGGSGSFILNLIWILLCGWELAVSAVCSGILWCITIIGIPFGKQFFKFAKLAFMPFGARVVTD